MEKRIEIIYQISILLSELIELDTDMTKQKMGRPKIHETAEIRKQYHSDKLKESKYSTTYYQNNKRRINCEHCDKSINNLAKYCHYKSKKCIAIQKEKETTI